MAQWQQQGHVIISRVSVPNKKETMPLVHSFHTSPLIAQHELTRIKQELPESLLQDVQIKQATLTFDFDGV